VWGQPRPPRETRLTSPGSWGHRDAGPASLRRLRGFLAQRSGASERWWCGAVLVLGYVALCGTGACGPPSPQDGPGTWSRAPLLRLRGGADAARSASAVAKAHEEAANRDKGGGWSPAARRRHRDESPVVSDVTSSHAPSCALGDGEDPACAARGRQRNARQGARQAAQQSPGQSEHRLLCSSATDSPHSLRGLDSRKVYLPWVLEGPRAEFSRSPSPVARPGSDRHLSSPAQTLKPTPFGAPESFAGRKRMDEIFKPTPFSTWANDAVRIRMVRSAADVDDPVRQFQPLFTHQVFGYKEEIVGFENPVVEIVYAANTLRPCISLRASQEVCASQMKDLGLNRTDVLECIRMHAPSDYAASIQDVLDEAADPGNGPFGTLLASYTQEARTDARAPAPCEQATEPRQHDSGGHSSSEFRVYATDVTSKEAEVVLRRVQSLAIWLIERASYIAPDQNWQLLTLYQHQDTRLPRNQSAHAQECDVKMREGGGSCSELVGFVTLYRDYKLNKRSTTTSSSSATNTHAPLSRSSSAGAMEEDDTGEVEDGGWAREGETEDGKEDKFRLRISQFVIMPPFQRRGHGQELLRAIYSLARSMPQCEEVCVENPSPGFCKLRDKTDARVLQELGFFHDLQADAPDWNALKDALKWSRTQLRHLHSSVVRKVARWLEVRAGGHSSSLLPSGVEHHQPSLCTVDGQTYYAGDFAMVRGAGNQILLAHLRGINPATKLLRVGWIYRWKDVATSAMMQSSRRWRSLLLAASRKKWRGLQEQAEVFFVFHEDFIHHQSLVEKCSVRFMCPETSPSAAQDELINQLAQQRNVFLCRFVYDPAKERVLSLSNRLIKTRYRRVLDTLFKEQQVRLHEGQARRSVSAEARRSISSDARTDAEPSEGGVSASGGGWMPAIAGSGDGSAGGWQMAAYDLSSVAYSDSPSASGSSQCSELVPYSPLGAGFERKEKQYVISTGYQRAASRSVSAVSAASALSAHGLVNWSHLRIRQVLCACACACARAVAYTRRRNGLGRLRQHFAEALCCEGRMPCLLIPDCPLKFFLQVSPAQRVSFLKRLHLVCVCVQLETQVRRKVCMRRGGTTPKLLANGPAGTRSPKKAQVKSASQQVKSASRRPGAKPDPPCMLPQPLVELLMPALPARTSSCTSLVQMAEHESEAVSRLLRGLQSKEVDKVLEALVLLADGLTACLEDLGDFFPSNVPKQQAQAQAPLEAHAASLDFSAASASGRAVGQHKGTWLADAMAWLRGMSPADREAGMQRPQAQAQAAAMQPAHVQAISAPPGQSALDLEQAPGTPVGHGARGEKVRGGTGVVGEEEEGLNRQVGLSLERSLLLQCKRLQAQLSKRMEARIFLTPVDPARDECPDYLHLIASPMDLGTVAARLAAGHYQTRSAVGAHLWFAGAFVPPVVPCGCVPYSGAALSWQQRLGSDAAHGGGLGCL
jgi:GNAT superfamily N-acetyltransferase